MKFKEIPQVTRANYQVNVPWDSLKDCLKRYEENYKFNLNPDFQRNFVWTVEQQIAYVEYILKGGISGRDILFNHPNWMGSFAGSLVIVDGKQRIKAVSDFLDDKIYVFGHKYSEYTDRLTSGTDFIFHINNLKKKNDVLQWYIDLNTGGTVHTVEEIKKVEKLKI